MKVMTNKGRRRLGIPGRPAIVLNPNETVPISEDQINDFHKNKTVVRWLEAGVLVLSDDKTGEPVHAPIGKTGIIEPRQPWMGNSPKPVDRDAREVFVLPEGVAETGVVRHHTGGGWYEVYVNGFKVTDRKVRKDEAEALAAEYEK